MTRKKRRLISLLLILALMAQMLPITMVSATEGPYIEGDFQYYVNDDGDVMLSNYFGERGIDLELPAELGGQPLKIIASGVLDRRELTAVSIPDSVERIVMGAFSNNRLTTVTIPASVTDIGNQAFHNNELSTVVVHNDSVTFGDGVFEGNASDLTLIGDVGSTTEAYADEHGYAFMSIAHYLGYGFEYEGNGDGTATITGWDETGFGPVPDPLIIPAELSIPDEAETLTVTGVGEEAFRGKGLTEVTISHSVTTIGAHAFLGNNLTELVIPESVVEIGRNAFSENDLSEVVIRHDSVTFGDNVFANNAAELTLIGGSTVQAYADGYGYHFIDIDGSGFQYDDHGDGTATITGWDEAVYGAVPDPLFIPDSVGEDLTVTTIGANAFRDRSLTDVTIPDEVTEIAEAAFADNALSDVTFSAALEVIGSQAFMGNKLEVLNIPASVTEIGAEAFANNELTEVAIPNRITEIGDRAFQNNGLTEIEFPEGLETIGEEAFRNNDLEDVEFPDNLTEIGARAFRDNSLSEAAFPEDLEVIGEEAFRNNDLVEVTFPDNLTTIGRWSFQDNLLTEVTLPDSVTTIGNGAFEANNLTEVTLPAGITSIESNVFFRNNLIAVDLPEGVQAIGNQSFFGNALAKVALPDHLETIGNQAFAGNALTEVIIPENVTQIGDGAFQNNDLTQVVISPEDVVFAASGNIFADNTDDLALVGYRGSTTEAYAAEHEYRFVDIRLYSGLSFEYEINADDTLTITGWNEADYGPVPTSLVIPEMIEGRTVTAIGEEAFEEKSLTEVSLPDTLTTIRDYAFWGNRLTELTLPDGVTSIGNYAFTDNRLEELTLPNTLAVIGNNVFAMNNLEEVVIPDGVTAIGNWAFGQNELTRIVIPDSVTTMGAYAFHDNKLTEVVFGTGLNRIADEAFSRNQLTSVVIPDGVTGIGHWAFYDNRLTEIEFGDDVLTIGTEAFMGNALESLDLPDSVTSIGNGAFGYNNLTSLEIPDSVTSIGNGAFEYNDLRTVIIHNDEVDFSGNVFPNNDPDLTLIGYVDSTTEGYAAEREHHFVDIVLYLGLGFEYEINADDTLTITGWNEDDYGPVPTSLVIPEMIEERTVTAIGGSAFQNNNLTEVIIPDSVVVIGSSAFQGNNLTEVVLGTGVEVIGDSAFQNNNLTEVIIPDNVTEIGTGAFWNNSLTEVVLGAGVETIGDSAFQNNTLTDVIIPDSVVVIGSGAFVTNTLTEVELGTGVQTIGNSAFAFNALTDVIIPDNVTEIGSGAFANNNLTEVELGTGVETIGSTAFQNNDLTEVIIPDNVTEIVAFAFRNNNLTEVIIHNLDVAFGNDVFEDNAADLTLIGHADSTTQSYAAEHDHRFVAFDSAPEVTIFYADEVVDAPIDVVLGASASLRLESSHSHFEIEGVEWTVDGITAGSDDTLELDTGTVGTLTVQATATTEYGGAATETVTVNVKPPVPDTPVLEVDSTSTTSIQVSWENVAYAEEYVLTRDGDEIYRGEEMVYEDTGLTPETTYEYSLKAVNDSGESGASTVTATTAARASGGSGGGGGAPSPSPRPPSSATEEEIPVVVEGIEEEVLVLIRTTGSNGAVTEELVITESFVTFFLDRDDVPDTLRLFWPEEEDVSRMMITIEKEAAVLLEEANVNVDILTSYLGLFLPVSSMGDVSEDLSLELEPVREEVDHEAISEQAQEAALRLGLDDPKVDILTWPVMVTTNVQGRSVDLTIPLPELDTENREDIVVFIEHSDEEQVLVPVEFISYPGTAGEEGVTFQVEKFSTFTPLSLEGWANYLREEEGEPIPPYIEGYPDGTFRPNESVTREQMATMLGRYLGSEEDEREGWFVDISDEHWAYHEISVVQRNGIMNGYEDRQFRPEEEITRAQMAVIAYRWMHEQREDCCPDKGEGTVILYEDVSQNHWAKEEIDAISQWGLMEGFGDNSFRPAAPLTRAQAVTVLNRLFAREAADVSTNPSFADVPVTHWAYADIETAARGQ
ncbi:leucine-rich repeat protein [Halalkalibacter oceani]|uniref:leucine-rich repeat protein n=1 Tax=Halalkalibacter oceani TaxID=1653776 RepID=UPI00339765EB